MAIDLISKVQIEAQNQVKTQFRVLIFDEIPIIFLAKYSNYNDVFLAKNAAEILEHTRINNHVIKLKKNKQAHFRPIYSLVLVELEILKTYIKTNLANGFIKPFKSFVRAIFFLVESQIEISAFIWITRVLIIS